MSKNQFWGLTGVLCCQCSPTRKCYINTTEGLHASLGPMKRKHVVPPPTSIIIVLVKEFEFIEFSAVIHTFPVFQSSIYFQTFPDLPVQGFIRPKWPVLLRQPHIKVSRNRLQSLDEDVLTRRKHNTRLRWLPLPPTVLA